MLQVKHHPSNVDLQILQKLVEDARRSNMNFHKFLVRQFSCIDDRLATDIIGTVDREPAGRLPHLGANAARPCS